MIRFYFHPTPQPRKDRALSGGDRSGLRSLAGRHKQGRAACAGLSCDQSERQGTGHRRYRGAGRQRSQGLRLDRHPDLSGGKDRPASGHVRGSAGVAVLAALHRLGIGAVLRAGRCTSSSPRPRAWTTRPIVTAARRSGTIRFSTITCPDAEFIVGSGFTIADISAWGWLDRASRVRKGAEDPLGPFPN